MIKAKGEIDGRPLVMLGLDAENVKRLMSGEPVRLDLAELGLPPCEVVLLYGATQGAIIKMLEPISGGAKLHIKDPPEGSSWS